MIDRGIHAVTGPFSYTGRYIVETLEAGHRPVRGFVRRPSPGRVPSLDCRRLQFTDIGQLTADLEGCSVLYNTYWIRFERGATTFEGAVQNSGILARAAAAAGVRRIIHLSVSNPDVNSPFAYFRGKARAESAILAAGVPAAIIRPTLVFGNEDILVNNIAWLLRRVHTFALPGNGLYRVQPVFVGDVARLAVECAVDEGDCVVDGAGPDTIPFKELVWEVGKAIGARALPVFMPPALALVAARLLSAALKDTLITDEEIGALMAEALVSHSRPTCTTSFLEWLRTDGAHLGSTYHSENKRHWSQT